LLRWFDLLPDEVLRTHPRLCLELSWPLILSEQLDRAESCLARAEQALHEDEHLLGELALAQAHIARVRGNTERAIQLSERALALADDPSVRSIAAVNVGIAQWYSGRLAEAECALSEAERAGQDSGNEYARWAGYAYLNRIRAARGALAAAAAAWRHMIQQAQHHPLISIAYYDLARLHYEWNELDNATEHLMRGLEEGRRSGRPELEIGGYATLAAITHARGDAAAARDALQQVDRLLDHPDISSAAFLYCLAFRIIGALAQSDLPAALLAADRAPSPEEANSFPDYLWLIYAQVCLLLHQARREAAADRSAALHGMASQAGWQSMAIRARTLQALSAPSSRDGLVFLSEALALAEPEGYTRTFADLGAPMAALLREAARQGIHVDYAQRLLAAGGPASVSIAGRAQPFTRQPLVEPLSERELEILRLLADRLTYDEIAHALYLSINTVKTHVRNIYGKLGVHRRRDAATRAKELGVLP
jgi:LuxR family maltose regulon positive regulatory protein